MARHGCAKSLSNDAPPDTYPTGPSVSLASVVQLLREHFDHLLSELTPESRRIEKQEDGIDATVHAD